MKLKKVLIPVLFLVLLAIACNNRNSSVREMLPAGNHKATVKEVIQTTTYTYLRLDEQGSDIWIAVDKQEMSVGNTVYYLEGLEMRNFASPELNRTFEMVYFVQDISNQPIQTQPHQQSVMGATEPLKPVLNKLDIQVELPEGAVAIGDLYARKAEYKGKSVTVRGQVTKVNTAIMNRNWIHLQDGTGDEAHFDLTVTSEDVPQVGEIVTYWGVVALDQDFGAGYTYELILEQAERMGN